MSKRIPILLGFILLGLALWLQVTSVEIIQRVIGRLENLAYDMQLRTKLATHQHALQTSVVIADIDDKSLDAEGHWPWPRSKIAELVQRLQEAGVVVIAFDMIYPEKEGNIADEVLKAINQNNLGAPSLVDILKKIQPYFDNDAKLAASLKLVDSVLGISFLPDHQVEGIIPSPLITLSTPIEKQLEFFSVYGYVANIPILATAAKRAGFINAYEDEDGVIRRVPLFLRYKDGLYPSLAFEAVRLYLLGTAKLVTAAYGNTKKLEGIKLDDYVIPTDDQAQAIVPYRGRSFTFPYYSVTDILHKKIPKDVLLGKIAFIGTSATGLGDLKSTSVQNVFPGVEIQATVADGILSHNFSYKPAWSLGAEIFLTIFLGGLFAWIFPYCGPRLLALMIIIVPAALIFGNNWLWEKTGLIIAIFIPILLTFGLALLNVLYGYLFETRKREQLKSIFGQYVPEEHIDEMLKSTGSYGMYGEDREMTVLFADIRNFTSISENLSATQLKEMLNEFFTPMTEVIFKHHGTIDKYVGDLIMAFWGAPLRDKRHAQHAVAAALDMQKTIRALQPMLIERGWPEINMGIGLNSGIMSVGDMGSKFRRNYTVLGDAVNLASRVEGLSKFYGVNIMVTEKTEEHQRDFLFRMLDRVRVKGKVEGVVVYEAVSRKSEASLELIHEIELSNIALNFYFDGNWGKALELFTELKQVHPDVKFYKLYIDRLAEFEKNPPPSDWGGIYTHTSK